MQGQLQLAAFATLAGFFASTEAISIGFGQQYREHDGQTYQEWVSWIHGESACPVAQDITAQQSNPCDIDFQLWGTTYRFQDCQDNIPDSVIDVAHPDDPASCSDNDNKIHCHGDQHDIIQKVQCVS